MESAVTSMTSRVQPGAVEMPDRNETRASGVSWSAVTAGAVVFAAVSLALLALGAGSGFRRSRRFRRLAHPPRRVDGRPLRGWS
jgi:hypothetical protein